MLHRSGLVGYEMQQGSRHGKKTTRFGKVVAVPCSHRKVPIDPIPPRPNYELGRELPADLGGEPPNGQVNARQVNPNEVERRAAAERSLSLRVTQMVGARPAPVLGSAAPDSSCGYSQQLMPMGYPPPPDYYQHCPAAAGPPLPGYYPQGPIAAGSAVRTVYNNRPQSPGPSALSRSQQSLMAPAGAPAGAPKRTVQRCSRTWAPRPTGASSLTSRGRRPAGAWPTRTRTAWSHASGTQVRWSSM